MAKLSQFNFDPRAEQDGVRVHVGSGLYITVGRIDSPKYKESVRKHTGPYKFEIDRGTLAEDTAQELLVKVYAETILLGWENLQDDAGNEIKFSRAEAEKALRDNPAFFEIVKDAASRVELFRQNDRSAAAKN